VVDWRRRVDPGFYEKEPPLLRTRAQVPRYPEEAQAEARLSVLRADRLLRGVTAAVVIASTAALTGAVSLDPRMGWVRFAAFAVIAAAGTYFARMLARVWALRARLATWTAFAALLVACGASFAFNAPALALHVPAEIAAIAVSYLGVCIIAVRIRRAELLARPEGLLSLPQSIVPLLDRSQHHAIICWRL
jgi:hypothetical protein